MSERQRPNQETGARLALATPDPMFEARVRQVLGPGWDNGEVVTWRAAAGVHEIDGVVAEMAGAGIQVVTVGPGLEAQMAVSMVRAFDRAHPEISVLLVAQPTSTVLEAALHAGVRDVVAPDSTDAELATALQRAIHTASQRRANLSGEHDAPPTGQVIAVVSPKGGAGKTTLAANLAMGLARLAPREVVVIDLDRQFGDVANALRIVHEHSVVDAARVVGQLDATEVKVFLAAHPAGVFALCGPEDPAEGDNVTAESIGQVVKVLAEAFRYVVVDTGSGLDDWGLAALDQATDCVLVCSTDVPTVRGLRKALHALDRAGATRARRLLVLNRSNAHVGLAAKDIEATVGLPVDIAIPSSRVVPLSTNKGSPILESCEPSVVTGPLVDLVERLAGSRVPLPPRRRRFARKAEG